MLLRPNKDPGSILVTIKKSKTAISSKKASVSKSFTGFKQSSVFAGV
jgi:hypothetical protein